MFKSFFGNIPIFLFSFCFFSCLQFEKAYDGSNKVEPDIIFRIDGLILLDCIVSKEF